MEITVSGQSWSFLLSLLFGCILGAYYDVFRIVRLAVRHGKVAVFIEDLIYFLTSAIAVFIFVFLMNSGEIRGFIVLGAFLGFLLYRFTLGVLVMGCSKAIIRFIKWIGRVIFRFVFAPMGKVFRFFFRLFRKSTQKTYKKSKKVAANAKFRLKRNYLLLYNDFIKKKNRPS